MKFKGYVITGLLALSALISPLSAQTALPKTLGFVSDYAKVLTPAEVTMLNSQSSQLKQLTGAEVATLIVPEMGDDWTIEHYATEVFEKWGIGEAGKDNGVLFLIALNDRKIRIEVGYGLEGILPDGKTGRILDTYVLPKFKTGDVALGIQAGHIALTQVIAAANNVQLSASPSASATPAATEASPAATVMILIFAGLFVFGLIKSPTFRHAVFALLIANALGGGRNRHGGGGHFGGGGFGGFGGGMSGGGGSSRGW